MIHKKLLSFSLLFLCLYVFPVCSSALAESRVVRICTGEKGASLRSTPVNLGEENKIIGIQADTVLDVLDTYGDWYYVVYAGHDGYVTALMPYTYVIEAEEIPEADFTAERENDLGCPQLMGRIIGPEEMNLTVLWTQVQLQATGKWYQDCEITGCLDERTLEEIRSFMKHCGYPDHTGWIDQAVINELVIALRQSPQPVPVGGIYRAMDAVMGGGSTGNMAKVSASVNGTLTRETAIGRWMQICLQYLGYYGGTVDGLFDEETCLALNQFQADHRYSACDYLTPGVARAMLEAYVQSGGDLNMLP